jgi:hypothetical protein
LSSAGRVRTIRKRNSENIAVSVFMGFDLMEWWSRLAAGCGR